MSYMEGEISYKRIAAFAIDTSFVILVSMVIISLTSMIPDATLIGGILVLFVIIGGYFVPYTLWPVQTFVKKSKKIKLTNMDGSECRFVRIVFREAFKVILSIGTSGVYCVIAGIIMLFRKDERTIHDFIFRTKVAEKIIITRKYIRKEEKE